MTNIVATVSADGSGGRVIFTGVEGGKVKGANTTIEATDGAYGVIRRTGGQMKIVEVRGM
jgi:hypothetical protein